MKRKLFDDKMEKHNLEVDRYDLSHILVQFWRLGQHFAVASTMTVERKPD